MLKFVTLILCALIAVFAINYYAEVNRLVLLLGIYPACAFGAIGLVAWFEHN